MTFIMYVFFLNTLKGTFAYERVETGGQVVPKHILQNLEPH